MPLPLTTDSLDSVPEPLRDHYTQQGDKFVLAVEGLPDTAGLKTALEKERAARAEFERKLSALKGIDPDEYARLRKEAEDRARTEAERRGEYDRVLKEREEEFRRTLGQKDQAAAKTRDTLEKYLVDGEATRAIVAAKGIPELLLPVIKPMTRVVERDGEYVVEVVTGNGTPRLNASGQNMTIGDLVEEMRASPTYSRAFEPSGRSGSGSSGAQGGGGNPGGGRLTPEQIEAMSMDDYKKARKEGRF